MKFGKLCYCQLLFLHSFISNTYIIKMEEFNALNSDALTKICRTCLSEDIDLQSLFESSFNEMIMACASVQIVSGDGLPETICKQCIHQVNVAFKFKQLCEKSDYHLRNGLTQKEPVSLEIKYEFEGVDNDSLEAEDDDDERIEIKPDLDGVFANSTERNVRQTNASNESDNVYYNQYKTRNKQDKLRTRGRPKAGFASRRSKRISKQNLEDDSDDRTSVKSEDTVNECSLCNQTISDTNQANHEENYHQPGKHTCLACRKEFVELKLLKRHLRVHKLEKKHVCITCGKGFYGANDLMIHTRVHTGEKPLECNVCTKTFSDPRGLNSHMKTHTGQKPYSCTVCNKRFAHSFVLSTHMRTHTAERPYICSACGKTFVYAHNLAIHTRSHTGERPYHCTLCPKAFSSSSTLSAHMMTHTGEKRFVCSVCGKKVARSGDLAIHMRTHTGEKPYACSICPKRYRMSCHLTAHMKTHTGEKDHVCSVCSKAFADARVLKSHMTTHTGERPYSCHVCQKSFAHYSALSNHRKIHIDKKLVPTQVQPITAYTSH